MMVRRNKLGIDAQTGITVSLGKIAKYLVVGLVLFDDVNNMLKHGRLAHTQWHGYRRLTGLGQLLRLFDLPDPTILEHLGSVFAQRIGLRDRNLVSCSQVGKNLPGGVGWLAIAAAQSL